MWILRFPARPRPQSRTAHLSLLFFCVVFPDPSPPPLAPRRVYFLLSSYLVCQAEWSASPRPPHSETRRRTRAHIGTVGAVAFLVDFPVWCPSSCRVCVCVFVSAWAKECAYVSSSLPGVSRAVDRPPSAPLLCRTPLTPHHPVPHPRTCMTSRPSFSPSPPNAP